MSVILLYIKTTQKGSLLLKRSIGAAKKNLPMQPCLSPAFNFNFKTLMLGGGHGCAAV